MIRPNTVNPITRLTRTVLLKPRYKKLKFNVETCRDMETALGNHTDRVVGGLSQFWVHVIWKPCFFLFRYKECIKFVNLICVIYFLIRQSTHL